jgi:hypothetical protein
MGDDTDVNLMRQALRQINNERGINKRFMPALKQFLSPYLTILSSGFTGYNQIMALQKALAQKTGEPVPAEPGMEPENIPEPSEEEILQYGNEVNMPTVTDQQKQEVADMIKKAQAGTLAKDKEAEKEKETMTASKYSEGVDELKRLAEIVEAMSDAYGEDQMVAPVELNPESPEQVEGSVEFKQHKNTDKGSVSVEASGETMQDLADVLKLAGLTLPKDMHSDNQASAHDEEPEQEDVLLKPNKDDDSPCGSDDADNNESYETDKDRKADKDEAELNKEEQAHYENENMDMDFNVALFGEEHNKKFLEELQKIKDEKGADYFRNYPSKDELMGDALRPTYDNIVGTPNMGKGAEGSKDVSRVTQSAGARRAG